MPRECAIWPQPPRGPPRAGQGGHGVESGQRVEVKRDPAEARALGDAMFLLYSGAVTEAQNCRNSWPVDAAKMAALKLCTTT